LHPFTPHDFEIQSGVFGTKGVLFETNGSSRNIDGDPEKAEYLMKKPDPLRGESAAFWTSGGDFQTKEIVSGSGTFFPVQESDLSMTPRMVVQ
jgi:hypothetical protein